MSKKVVAAMSGGVDSSVCASILKDEGYLVTGATMKLAPENKCSSSSDIDDANEVCRKLGIPHFVYNMEKDFTKNVIEKFISQYENGYTPNPCVECNRYIKFKAFTEKIKELDADTIATGHYAQVEYSKDLNRWLLKKAKDTKKDQTYFLYNLTQEELSHVLFPLGNLTKEEARAIAERYGFSNSNKPDSQDICFIPDGDYAKFIKNYRKYEFEKGDFIDTEGNVLGQHQGFMNYTIGQRKGLGITFGKPMYVVGKNKEKNQIILGEEKDLYSTKLYAKDINLISVPKIEGEMKITAKTRYSQLETPATVTQLDDRIKVVFDTPVRAITSGQAVVLYEGDTVVGGGIIE